MISLAVYLFCVSLLVLGALCFIAAMYIPGRMRMMVACLAACVPIAAAVWIFRSSGLRENEFGSLLKTVGQELGQVGQNIKKGREIQAEIDKLFDEGPPHPRR